MDELRSQRKTMNRQFDSYMKYKTAIKNDLINLIDQTYPGTNAYFDSPARENGNQSKTEEIYRKAKELIPVLPKDNFTKRIVKQTVGQLKAASQTVEQLHSLMAETRFTHKGAVTAFAVVDSGVNKSGNYSQKSVHASKHGSPVLRKTLFQIMYMLIKTKPDDTVYLFIDKKCAQGKPYYVYMAVETNKCLRIYYGRSKEYLATLPMSS